jgi:hypothetical protein
MRSPGLETSGSPYLKKTMQFFLEGEKQFFLLLFEIPKLGNTKEMKGMGCYAYTDAANCIHEMECRRGK